jgi:hypothetical protein
LRRLRRRALELTGFDRAIGWSAAPRLWTSLFGPVTVALIATRLTAEEQGFYFTFNSIAALQVFFDLGLSAVILQFASHERAFLEWQPDGTIGGSAVHKGRLASLLRKAMKWYVPSCLLLAIALLIGGTIFFASRPAGVSGWEGPWVIVALMAAGTLMLSPALAALEGCGAVADVARIRMEQVVLGHLVGWSFLLAGGRLWAPAATAVVALLFGAVRVLGKWRHVFTDLLRTEGEVSWRAEVWPFQWRMALAFMTSYFIFQIFTPVLFLYQGPVAAGRMGMTIAIVNTMLSVAMTWVWTKRPLFGMRIARREFGALNRLFFPAMLRSFAVMLCGCVAFVGATFLLGVLHHPWRARLLDPLPLLMLTGAFLATQLYWSQSAYLRAHKKEPLLGIRLVSAVMLVTSTLVLGRIWGATGMMAGFLAVSVVVCLGGGTWIFLRKRREWHAQPGDSVPSRTAA